MSDDNLRDWCIITCPGCGKQKRHRAHGKCGACCSAERRASGRTIQLHGYGGYTDGCRCEICRGAKAAYVRERRNAAYLNTAPGPVSGVTHGTRFAYEERGCRCGECVTAERASSRHRPKVSEAT